MFGFLGDNIDSVKQAAETSNIGKQESQEGSGPAAGAGDGGLAAGLPGFGGFWSVAKAVQSAVQQTADEVVRSVQTTDWKSELAAFTQEVEAEAHKVSHKAAEVVQHLPAQLHTRSSETGAGGDGSEGGEGGSPSGSSGGGSGQPFGAVGSSLANFGKQLISGTREVIDTVTDLVEGEIATAAREVPRFAAGSRSSSVSGGRPDAATRLASRQRLATKYSRFEAEVAAMQRDSATYVDEPEDAEDFAAWRASSSFSMDTAQPEVDKILAGNAFLSELQGRLVPLLVEKEDFWARYFYRLHKLQQKEEQRQQLAARAKQLDDAEDLGGWDDDESPHAAAAAAQTEAAAPPATAAVCQQEQEQPDEEQQQQPEPAAGEPADAGGTDAAAASADEEKAQAGSTSEGLPAAVHEPQELQRAPTAAAAAVPESGGKAPAAAAAAAAAVTAATTAVARKLSDESSFPSTPVQVGSDASDAAVATDTVSEASGATAAGGQAPWTLVTGSPSAPTPAAAAAASAAAAAATPAGEDVSKAGVASAPAKQEGPQQQHMVSEPAAAETAASSSPAAAAAKPAAAAVQEDDDDWGDDADDAVAAVAGSKAGAAGAATAAAGEGDDDWGNWE